MDRYNEDQFLSGNSNKPYVDQNYVIRPSSMNCFMENIITRHDILIGWYSNNSISYG